LVDFLIFGLISQKEAIAINIPMKSLLFIFIFFLLPPFCIITKQGNFSFNTTKCIDIPATFYDGHIQGVTTDGMYMYYSYTRQLKKTDSLGVVTDTTLELSYHHGDLTYYDSKIYVAHINNSVKVYNASDLSDIGGYPLTGFTGAEFPGGISYYDGAFYVAVGVPRGNYNLIVRKYDLSFNYVTEYSINLLCYQGIQSISRHNGSWWIGTYSSDLQQVRVDDNFNIEWIYDTWAPYGFPEWKDNVVLLPTSWILQFCRINR